MATASTTKSAENGGEVVGTDNKKLSVQQLSGDTSPSESFKDWVARVPRKAVLHRMETAESLEDRVFWAIILWSWCGPQINDAVVIKNRSGYIQRDANGKPVPAKLLDLLALLGLAPAMKGNLSRAIQRLAAKGSIRYESRVLYPVKEPVAPEKRPPPSAKGETFFIARIVINIGEVVVGTDNDQVARTEISQWLNGLSTEWKTGLKNLKTEYRELVVRGFRERSILIGLEEKKRRRDIENNPAPTNRPSAVANEVGRWVAGPLQENLQENSSEPERTGPEPPPQPAKPLPEMDPLQAEIRKWLVNTYTLPTAPSAEVLAELTGSCKDAAGFEQFKTECTQTQNAAPKSYRYFLTIARRCAEHRPEYEEAMRLKQAKPATHSFDEERLRRLAAEVEEDRKWR